MAEGITVIILPSDRIGMQEFVLIRKINFAILFKIVFAIYFKKRHFTDFGFIA